MDLEVRIEPNDGDPYLVIQHEGINRSYLSLFWHVKPEELESLANELRATQRAAFCGQLAHAAF